MTNKIKDLDFLETFNHPAAHIWGGIYTGVSVSAYTSKNFALAGSGSIALGNNTSTWAQTNTNLFNALNFSSSYAQASGIAGAYTESDVSSSVGVAVSAFLYWG
jgi:hypothetical protein